MPRLRFESDVEGESIIDLIEAGITIGREADNIICIEDSNLSKYHAVLVKSGPTYKLFDVHSTNGTFVNGQRVTYAELKDGDSVRIGPIRLRYEMEPKKVLLRPGGPQLRPQPGAKPAVAGPVVATKPALQGESPAPPTPVAAPPPAPVAAKPPSLKPAPPPAVPSPPSPPPAAPSTQTPSKPLSVKLTSVPPPPRPEDKSFIKAPAPAGPKPTTGSAGGVVPKIKPVGASKPALPTPPPPPPPAAPRQPPPPPPPPPPSAGVAAESAPEAPSAPSSPSPAKTVVEKPVPGRTIIRLKRD
jgi:hypothetical protein